MMRSNCSRKSRSSCASSRRASKKSAIDTSEKKHFDSFLRCAMVESMRKTESKPWFDVDKKGLQKLLADRGIEFAIFELIQNAWDEAGVSRVDVTLKPDTDGMLCAELTVSDDAPNGFADLRHAYTLFAESAKKDNPKQRGRFNIGEKLVLSQCVSASIKTTKGTVYFGSDGSRSQSIQHSDHG